MSLAINLEEQSCKSDLYKSINIDVLPPMLRQYVSFKNQYPDCLLLFQVGDFYEAFFSDAEQLAATLNVTLTSRDKNSTNPIPMAGVPLGVVDGYVGRLVASGISVALVVQNSVVENGVVTRRLDRIVTPGVNISGHDLSNSGDNLVAAFIYDNSSGEAVLSFSSVESGKIYFKSTENLDQAIGLIQSLSPRELIIPSELNGQRIDRRVAWLKRIELALKDGQVKQRALQILPGAAEADRLTAIQGYSVLSTTARKAVRLLLQYVDEVTVTAQLPFLSIENAPQGEFLLMDATTRRNLELVKTTRDNTEVGSFFSALNRTASKPGARQLKNWILQPLVSIPAINQRLDAVQELILQDQAQAIQQALVGLSDLERIAARIELGIILPFELVALRDSLAAAQQLRSLILESKLKDNKWLNNLAEQLLTPQDIIERLNKALAESIPITNYHGKIFNSGFDQELDRILSLKDSGAAWMMQLEARERSETGINSLKVKHNNVHGYFIEITKANAAKAPEHYIRKQTTVNAERFFIAELKEMEQQLYSADSKLQEREHKLYLELLTELKPHTVVFRVVHEALASLDVLASFAAISVEFNLTRPELTDGRELKITNGRHPVLMQLLGTRLISNSLELTKDKIGIILTGANMGGKSTYLRQAALITIMAQMGCYVPAEKAALGVADRIFARLGASDDMLEGESTFMVEMREAANIIANASSRSLLLIDEIGRGTATADGLAIARAILEWVSTKIKCRTLFATHFHELTCLTDSLTNLINSSVAAIEVEGSFIFTHEIKPGAADRSYGLEVAKLAGLPKELINRAQVILNEITIDENSANSSRQLSLFKNISSSPGAIFPVIENLNDNEFKISKEEKEVLKALKDVNLDQLTPLQALNFIADRQKILKGD